MGSYELNNISSIRYRNWEIQIYSIDTWTVLFNLKSTCSLFLIFERLNWNWIWIEDWIKESGVLKRGKWENWIVRNERFKEKIKQSSSFLNYQKITIRPNFSHQDQIITVTGSFIKHNKQLQSIFFNPLKQFSPWKASKEIKVIEQWVINPESRILVIFVRIGVEIVIMVILIKNKILWWVGIYKFEYFNHIR